MEPEEEEDEAPAEKSQLVPTIIAFAVVTVIAAGAGWFLGGDFSTRGHPVVEEKVNVIVKKADMEAGGGGHGEGDEEDGAKHSGPTVAMLNPIVSSLNDPNGIWLRIEVAVIFGEGEHYEGEIDKISLQNDIVAYLRTIDSALISGPSGFVHFHEDLVDRVRMTTGGRANDVKILSLVAE